MNKITDILTFSVLIIALSAQLSAAPLLISIDKAIEIKATSDRPITVGTNFEIETAELIVVDKEHASLKLLRKGFILIPRIAKFKVTIVLSARDGSVYTVNIEDGGKKSVFRVEDPLQLFNTSVKKFNFESGKMDQDARNIIKTILLKKPLSGFEKSLSSQTIDTEQYNLTRVERHTGSRYVVDGWNITNISNESLYFNEEDFYTSGILAVALEKNRVLKGETVFLYIIINKNTVFEAEKRER